MAGTAAGASTSLITTQRAAEQARQQAQADYVTLLNADTGTQADIDALTAAAKTLGKSGLDVQKDAQQIADAKALAARMQALAGSGVVNQLVRGYLAAYPKMVDAVAKRLHDQQWTLEKVRQDSQDLLNEFANAKNRLTAMKAANPVLAPIAVPGDALTTQQPANAPEVMVPSFGVWLAAFVTLATVPLANSTTPFPAVP